MRDVQFFNDNALVNVDDVAFTFETAEKPREFDKHRMPQTTLDWTDQDYQVGEYRVYPYGANNDLPKIIKDDVQNNSLAPGYLKKKAQLFHGEGALLYRTKYNEKNQPIREWVEDRAIMNWLESWGYEEYIQKSIVDYAHIEGVFTKLHSSKGARIGKPSIAKLEHVSPKDARLANDITADYDEKPKYCIITDWMFRKVTSLTNYKVYPLFNFLKPFEHRTSILYSNMYSFCSDYYTVPDIYGSLEWMRRSTAIPMILKALSKNSINLKYHVISPSQFWTEKRDELKAQAESLGKVYDERELIKYKTNFLRQIGKVLSGEENTGKFWHSVKYMEIEGHKLIENGWEIKEIKQNIKDFVSAQIQISEHSNRAIGATVGMHPSLAGAGESGRADSGSEQLNALKNYMATGIRIPETIILKAVNYAIRVNFPEKDLKLGFYHVTANAEQDITPSERITNKV